MGIHREGLVCFLMHVEYNDSFYLFLKTLCLHLCLSLSVNSLLLLKLRRENTFWLHMQSVFKLYIIMSVCSFWFVWI